MRHENECIKILKSTSAKGTDFLLSRCDYWVKYGFWTFQRGILQHNTQQKATLQLLKTNFVWGLNVTQFSHCKASIRFSDSSYCSNVSTFHAAVDLDRKAAMSNNHLVLSQLAQKPVLLTLFVAGDNTGWKMLSILTKAQWIQPFHNGR